MSADSGNPASAEATISKASQAVIQTSPIQVTDLPKFDLESYISNYSGVTRTNRLILIATSSQPPIATDALALAITEARAGRNIDQYVALCNYASELPNTSLSSASDPSIFKLDSSFVDSRRRAIAVETDKLDRELKGYKNNLIKESIRMGNEEVGMHAYDCGDYAAAWRLLNKMREYCTTPKHIAEMFLKLILVGVAMDNWLNVSSSVYKIEPLQLRAEEKTRIDAVTRPALGLAELAQRKYANAASRFLTTPVDFMGSETIAGIQFERCLCTGNDIAVYGGLCALATYDRQKLTSDVLENNEFRSFLELEPQVKRAISAFVNGKYTSCLEILEAYKTDWLLDVYLQRHLLEIYSLIRKKSIVAYFAPYDKVSIRSLIESFGAAADEAGATDVEKMEYELVNLISKGELNARIDAVEHILLSVHQNDRSQVVSDALRTANETEKMLRLRLMRSNMLAMGWEVKGKADGGGRQTDWQHEGAGGFGQGRGKGRPLRHR